MNYKDLKTAIYKSVEKVSKREENTDFRINFEALKENVKDLGLTPVYFGIEARRITINDIPLFAEYFKSNKMDWLNKGRYITSLAFIETEKIDEEAQTILNNLADTTKEDPDLDKVNDFSYLIGNYPCYFALATSYMNNSPEYYGSNSYFVACRSNKVVFKDPNYVYNPQDLD